MAGKINENGKTYQESNAVPVVGEYDVIVAGGGPAGVAAALAAARRGVRVLLVESYGFLGGMWTMGMVVPIFDAENKGGICAEIVDAVRGRGMMVENGPGMPAFDIETMKNLLDEMTVRAGVDVLLHTQFCSPIVEDGQAKGIVVENKGGRAAYLARVTVDATGDGDVAARAGAPFETGSESGVAQPMTLMFRLSNIDYVQDFYRYPHYQDNELIHKIDDALQRAGVTDYDFNYRRPCVLRVPGEHTAICQATHIRGCLSTDPLALSKAEMEGRHEVQRLMELLRTYLPQFRNAQLDTTGPHIGIRESRHIRGEYYLTMDDLSHSRRFEDGICTATFWVDIHQQDGINQEAQTDVALQPSYQVPYRCLVPLKVENLLVAGRCISGSFEAHASYRVTGNCVAMGQAAGTAAAMCVLQNATPRRLEGARVAQEMKKDGALC